MESIRISCVGDFLPADTAYTLGNGIGSSMDRLISFYSVKENNPFLNSDIIFCNLESPLINTADTLNLPFAGNPEVIELMKILNISVVSIANNHILDHGTEGLNQTIKALDENGIIYTGLKEDGISKIAMLEMKGKKFAFAAFNSIDDHPEDTFIAPLGWDLLLTTLNQIKNQSPDFIIFSFHWGNEYVNYPSPSQLSLAHELIDNGVNIIIGHHPHVIQPVEKYHGGVIIYSPGNFLFDSFWSERVRNGMQVDLVLNEDKPVEYQLKPFRIKSDFTTDYTKAKVALSMLAKSDKTMAQLKAGRPEIYLKTYLEESRRQRLLARYKMKIYLLKHFFRLSAQSRQLFFRNIVMKSALLWRRN